jgi:predicted metal-dependent phosphotriesterase family hydrolase
MGTVNTVLGPIPTEALGTTAMHEHIGFGLPDWSLEDKWWAPAHRMIEVACEKIGNFNRLGGSTFVDLTGIGFGRDIPRYQVISKATGVNIVACTGFWTGTGVRPYFRSKSIDYLTDLFVKEITVGIDNTSVKAGIIKVGVSKGGLTDLDERIYRAAARAAIATGASVTTHLSTDATRQLDWFEDEGLALNRVVLGHADSGLDYQTTRDLMVATRGAYVGFDMIGYDIEKGALGGPTPLWSRRRDERMRQVLDLLEAGYADRTIISADANCWTLGWDSPPHSVAELLEYFLPDLRAAGVDEQTVDQLLVKNPAELLTLAEPQNP